MHLVLAAHNSAAAQGEPGLGGYWSSGGCADFDEGWGNWGEARALFGMDGECKGATPLLPPTPAQRGAFRPYRPPGNTDSLPVFFRLRGVRCACAGEPDRVLGVFHVGVSTKYAQLTTKYARTPTTGWEGKTTWLE